MEGKLRQSLITLFKDEKLILCKEETTSTGGCGTSLVIFSRPALYCPCGSTAQGVFVVLSHDFL
ncbi:hypothetical protein [Intestinimonas sp.]|uniref:hypothetical protein n=1 Tax=Intestinimonas sp. TaxID=1965293 RepID=UPI0026022C4C|nr:hypothetical protein [Intestinimonas sp.]